MKKLLISSLAFSMVTPVVNAAPGEATSHLMNDPASMLDIGILKLERDMDDILRAWSRPGSNARTPDAIFVTYDWNDDEVLITSLISGVPDVKEGEAECRKVITRLRANALVDADGEVLYQQVYSRYASFFAHEGFERSGAPEEILQKLDQRIAILCATTNGIRVEVKSRLRSSRVSVTTY